jgi:hypothetical protein
MEKGRNDDSLSTAVVRDIRKLANFKNEKITRGYQYGHY